MGSFLTRREILYALGFIYFFWPKGLPPLLQGLSLFFMGLALGLRVFRAMRGPYHPEGPLTLFDVVLVAVYFTGVAHASELLWPEHSLWALFLFCAWFVYASFFFPYDWLWAQTNGKEFLSPLPLPPAMETLFRTPPALYLYHSEEWRHPYRLAFPFTRKKAVLVSEDYYSRASETGARAALYHLLLQERSHLARILPWVPPAILAGAVLAITRTTGSGDIRVIFSPPHHDETGTILLAAAGILSLHLLFTISLRQYHRQASLFLALDHPERPETVFEGNMPLPFFTAYLRRLRVPPYPVLKSRDTLRLEEVLANTEVRSQNRYRLADFPRPRYRSLEEWEKSLKEISQNR
ncbi:MAG: hypothetical protein KM310_00515 [Clostridiales bacterium]|nr:hypothetical protein [Clostridiales bacterium]